MPLRSGLTVFYGRNGAGKTRVLEAATSALTGVALPIGKTSVHLSFTDEFEGWHPHLIETIGADNTLLNSVLELLPNEHDENGPAVDEVVEVDDLDADERLVRVALRRARHRVMSLAQLHGLAEGLCHSPRIALASVGDVHHPMWDVGLSVVPTDAEAFQAANPRITMNVDAAGSPLPVVVASLQVGGGAEFGDWRGDGLAALGEIACLAADDSTDIEAMTLRRLQSMADGSGDLLEATVDGSAYKLADSVSQLAASLARWATSIADNLTGRPLELHCAVRNPNSWLTHGPIAWTALDDHGREMPISSLGSGQARWARLAISLSLTGGDLLRPATIVIDEPERALHSAAQQDIATAFQNAVSSQELLGIPLEGAIVATHSPAFLALPDAHLLHVTRGTSGDVELRELDTTLGVESLTAQLGITRSDALLTIRSFIFVEGEHELSVLSALFRDAMRQRHVVMVPMRGAANIGGYIAAQNLLTYSDATIRVVVDRMGQKAEEKWTEAREAFADGDRAAASRGIHKLEAMSGDHFNWLFNAGRAALEIGCLDRIELVVLRELDVVKYLPAPDLIPGALSWDELDHEYRQLTHPRPAFKTWLKQSKGATITADRLGEIAARCGPTEDIGRAVEGL
ncbi:MAG: AAA family ATPase [Solirubrobacterales bacterium]